MWLSHYNINSSMVCYLQSVHVLSQRLLQHSYTGILTGNVCDKTKYTCRVMTWDRWQTNLELSASPLWTPPMMRQQLGCTPHYGWAETSPVTGYEGWWWPSPGIQSNGRMTGSTCTCREALLQHMFNCNSPGLQNTHCCQHMAMPWFTVYLCRAIRTINS